VTFEFFSTHKSAHIAWSYSLLLPHASVIIAPFFLTLAQSSNRKMICLHCVDLSDLAVI
jgi:hypothetical protein